MRHAVPVLLSAVVLGLAGCEPPVEGFETELRFVTPPNQDVFAELERLEVTFYYSGEEPIGFVIDEPFPAAQDLDDLPRAEAGEVRLEVLGWVEDGAAADGWRLAAQGEATDFALPADDPITVFLALKGQLAELPGELIHARSDGVAVPIDDHRAMIVGGLDEEGPVGPVELLEWDAVRVHDGVTSEAYGDLPRVAHTAFLVTDSGTAFDGRVTVVGGDASCPEFYCFPVNDAVTMLVAIRPGDMQFTDVSDNNLITVGARDVAQAGGRRAFLGGFNEGSYLTAISQFDPEAQAVAMTADALEESREQHAVTPLQETGGSVLVSGGFVLVNNTEPIMVAAAEIWSGSGDAVLTTGELNEPRFRHTGTLLEDGSVLIAGGATGDSWDDAGTALASAELYNPSTQEFTLLSSSLAYARQRHVAVRLDDEVGSVLICGGVVGAGGGAPVQPCERYDPTTQTFSVVEGSPLDPGGEGMMLVPLEDGSMLLLGGMADGVAQDEIYRFIP